MDSSAEIVPTFIPFAEDDDFEDFEQEDWDESLEDKEDATLWLDNWDAEEVQDEFLYQLRYLSNSHSLTSEQS